MSRGNPGLKGRLIDKSMEAYILSLETINALSIKYRIETFCYLICNAQELLLKAKILDDTGKRGSIYYSRNSHRTLALRDCLPKIYLDERDAVRVNIEKLAGLRDEACHLVITRVPREVLGLFHASVINEHSALNRQFNRSLSDRVSVGMMSIVYDFAPDQFDVSAPRLRREMGKETAEYLMRLQADIQERSEDFGNTPDFAVGIDYKLALIRRNEDADICLSTGQDGGTARIVKVPKDSFETHPHSQSDLVNAVNQLLGIAYTINSYDIQCVVHVFKVKLRPEFFYRGKAKYSPTQYSQDFADWMYKKFQNDADFFHKAREQRKEDISKRI